MKEGTDDTPHGIGIQVRDDGCIKEGYWKDGELHGRGRRIYHTFYYIGEWKGDNWSGEGTLYHHGDIYTGIWDGYWKGKGEINYKDGKKYTGEWDNSVHHGLGTLYSADGQVLNQGKWYRGEYKGKE